MAVGVDDNSSCRYHDAVAGACGEVDVVPVRGGAVVPPRDVVSNVPADTVHSLAGAVRACGTHTHTSFSQQNIRVCVRKQHLVGTRTETVPPAVLEDAARSLLGIFRERWTVQKFWETAERHHLDYFKKNQITRKKRERSEIFNMLSDF